MIKFDPTLLTTEIVFIKQITTAVGGSMIFTRHPEHDIEQAERCSVPVAVARNFIKASKNMTRFLKPVPVYVVRYADTVVCIERNIRGSLAIDMTQPNYIEEWNPVSKLALELFMLKQYKTYGEWYTDGRYVYAFKNLDMDTNVHQATFITSNGKMRILSVVAFDLYKAYISNLNENHMVHSRECVAYVASDSTYAVSPPIWKNAKLTIMSAISSSLSDSNIKEADNDIEQEVLDDFTLMFLSSEEKNEQLRAKQSENPWMDPLLTTTNVNLSFGLYAAQVLAQHVGHEEVLDVFQMPELMIDLRTVNLFNLKTKTKKTYPLAINLEQAFAWLLGKLLVAQTNLAYYQAVSRAIKYLTRRGLYEKDALTGLIRNPDNWTVPVVDVAI